MPAAAELPAGLGQVRFGMAFFIAALIGSGRSQADQAQGGVLIVQARLDRFAAVAVAGLRGRN